MFDGKAFGDEMAGIVRSYVDKATAPLIAENKALAERVAAIEAIPAPAKGDTGDKGDMGPQGEPGVADMDAVKSLVTDAVADAVAALPAPERGEKGDAGDVGPSGESGRDGQDGKDGAGIADLLIDNEGALVATFTDGRMKTLGAVVGRDGVDGERGADGETFTLDDFEIVPLDERTIKMCFTKGQMHSFELKFPVIIDRGVYSESAEYERGDAVTWSGSLWIAQGDTKAKPDGPESGWRLAVKKGRDGKDAK